ncbi:MAG: helix-turn-helix domain-containing protein [Proteobacteria bacterium]|nr:helix-turn-helix domain-containing protein [Pseudomonadota bacterium]MCP4919397.1 helix-turn-helix domain-containing protein [Pseudomonadota bacterium]
MASTPESLTRRIGSRVRLRRIELGQPVRVVAERSGLSARFLADVESGKANISITRLSQLADALELPLTALLQPGGAGPRARIDSLLAACSDAELRQALGVLEVALGRKTPRIVALLGIRGAGKSTVGQALAGELQLPFVELDQTIEALAGMRIGDIFTMHGEAYYRELELKAFAELVAEGTPCVVALPGGVVGSEAARKLIREGCTSVWLKAEALDYWNRVFATGDTRPMEGRSDAMDQLQALIRQRAPLYEDVDLTIDTSGRTLADVVTEVLAGLDASSRRP